MLTLPYRIRNRATDEEGTVEDVIAQVSVNEQNQFQNVCFLVVAWDNAENEDGSLRAPFDIVVNTPDYENLGHLDMGDEDDTEETEEPFET